MEQTFEARFLSARRAVIAARFQNLNDMQREGVLTTQGPLLLLAGAGSGKTTVLINRIANLIAFGEGSDSNEIPEYIAEEDVTYLEDYLKTRDPAMQQQAERLCALRPAAPWSILAITFTNKAANELKARLQALLGDYAMDVWAMTFHAACCRILRREIDRLDGYTGRFTIYDTSDSERVMKDILKDFGLDEKSLPPRLALSVISKAKDKRQNPELFPDTPESPAITAWIASRSSTPNTKSACTRPMRWILMISSSRPSSCLSSSRMCGRITSANSTMS